VGGTLTVDDLADRLDARFELLVAERSGGGPRHRTLGAVIDWSYRLLPEPEQLLFARLHVFAATFDIAAAEAVTADEQVPPDLVAHLVGRLAERSLLTRPGYAGAGRYRMLDTLRRYAATRLPPDEVTRLCRRHAEHVVALAEQAGGGLLGAGRGAVRAAAGGLARRRPGRLDLGP
jgi:predicted ATPase